jgi:putative transposase
MKNRTVRQRKHRLPRELYRGSVTCAFTICVLNQAELFVTQDLFCRFEGILQGSLTFTQCEAQVYLFMPDHLHLLLQGTRKESDLWSCVENFKQLTGFWLAQRGYKDQWQKGFYDHILRKDEDVVKQVIYILNNPVRKGIVENWKEYPFKGSTVYDLANW